MSDNFRFNYEKQIGIDFGKTDKVYVYLRIGDINYPIVNIFGKKTTKIKNKRVRYVIHKGKAYRCNNFVERFIMYVRKELSIMKKIFNIFRKKSEFEKYITNNDVKFFYELEDKDQ